MRGGGKHNFFFFFYHVDKKLRVQSAECLARIPQVMGFCFGVTAPPTSCSPNSQHVPHNSQQGHKLRDRHLAPYVTDKDTRVQIPGATTRRTWSVACRLLGTQTRDPRPPDVLNLSFLLHPSTLIAPSSENSGMSTESLVLLCLEINIKPGNHPCSFPVFLPMP